MKVLIPAKSNSIRIYNKNFRDFYNNESLVELLIKKLLKIFNSSDIYLSCDEDKKDLTDKYNINFLKRSKELCSNDVPMSLVITTIINQMNLDNDEEIMWTLVTDPFFDDYEECLKCWNSIDHNVYDSLTVVYEHKGYALDYLFKPINCGFGKEHIPTQYIKPIYKLNNTLFIASVNTILSNNYYLGLHPYWYISNSFSIDIDDENDFKIAKSLYNICYE